MCIRDSFTCTWILGILFAAVAIPSAPFVLYFLGAGEGVLPVSYTHLRAHETVLDLVCRLLLEKKNKTHTTQTTIHNTSSHNNRNNSLETNTYATHI